MVGGFPNLWGWGNEDYTLHTRVLSSKLKIDRSSFLPVWHKNIIHLSDGSTRLMHRNEEIALYSNKNNCHDISNLRYHIVGNMINIEDFTTSNEFSSKNRRIRDLLRPEKKTTIPMRF
tara:strand:- start:183 stop:536 length:354 start_codon:yes stop_codon:yes gene_type:complete